MSKRIWDLGMNKYKCTIERISNWNPLNVDVFSSASLNWQHYYHEIMRLCLRFALTIYLPPNWHMTFNVHDFVLFNFDESSRYVFLDVVVVFLLLVLFSLDEAAITIFSAAFSNGSTSARAALAYYAISHWKGQSLPLSLLSSSVIYVQTRSLSVII